MNPYPYCSEYAKQEYYTKKKLIMALYMRRNIPLLCKAILCPKNSSYILKRLHVPVLPVNLFLSKFHL